MFSSTGKPDVGVIYRDDLESLARLAMLGRSDALVDALRAHPDPAELATAAQYHGLAAIFYAFSRSRLAELPPAMAERLAAAHRLTKVRSIVLLAEAARVIAAFEERGIPCVPLKGAALAEDLYGNPALRPMTDVDLLVPHDAITAARELMAAAGYNEEEGDLREGFEEEFRSELSFFRTVPYPTRIEIHWGLLNFGDHDAWTTDALARSLMTPRGRRLSLEDTLLYLASHAAYHHQNDRLVWEFDVALLLQTHGTELDHVAVGVIAQEHRLMMPLRWALETGERLGAPAPSHLVLTARNRPVGRVERWLLRYARDPQLAGTVRTLLTIRATPGFRRRLRLIAAKMFPDRKHLEVRHQARGFLPWIYARRIATLSGRLILGVFRRPRSG